MLTFLKIERIHMPKDLPKKCMGHLIKPSSIIPARKINLNLIKLETVALKPFVKSTPISI